MWAYCRCVMRGGHICYRRQHPSDDHAGNRVSDFSASPLRSSFCSCHHFARLRTFPLFRRWRTGSDGGGCEAATPPNAFWDQSVDISILPSVSLVHPPRTRPSKMSARRQVPSGTELTSVQSGAKFAVVIAGDYSRNLDLALERFRKTGKVEQILFIHT